MKGTTLRQQMRGAIDEYVRVREQLHIFENQHRSVLDRYGEFQEQLRELEARFMPDDDGLPLLSTRQLDVLRLIAAGLTNEEMGRELFIAPDTVRTHVRDLLNRLGAKNRPQAVAEGMRRGLIK